MQNRASVLIVAHSAQIRDSLLVLLRAIPQIEAVHQAEDGPSALAMGQEIQPTLVMLDDDLPDDKALQILLGQMIAMWPQARCLVLLDDEQDRRSAQEAGADVVLVKGVRAATVLEMVEHLLSEDPGAQ
jgi:DNA-binding NarL/FixJ family response regulator